MIDVAEAAVTCATVTCLQRLTLMLPSMLPVCQPLFAEARPSIVAMVAIGGMVVLASVLVAQS